MNWTAFWPLSIAAASLMLAAYAVYLQSGAPGLLEWDGVSRTTGVLFFAAGVFMAGLAQRRYDIDRPPTVFSGVADYAGCYRNSCLLKLHDATGKNFEFNTPNAWQVLGMEHESIRMYFASSSKQVVRIEYVRADGTQGEVTFRRSVNGLWTMSSLLLLFFAIRRKAPSV